MGKSGEERRREYEKRLRETAIPTIRIGGSGKVNIPGIGEMRISGSGHVSPEEIKISGSGSLPGGIKVGRIKGSGSVSIGGDIEADEMRFSGSASVAGSVNSSSLSSSGSFKAEGEARGGFMRFSGSCKIGKEIQLEDSLVVHGSLTVLGNVTVGKLVELNGRFDIGGKLVASTFRAELSRSRSHIRNGVQADSVDVRKRGKFEGIVLFGFPIFGKGFREGELSTTDIVGTGEVYIENVFCDNVTGKDVTIGDGCQIKGMVRYSKTIRVSPTAKVEKSPIKVA